MGNEPKAEFEGGPESAYDMLHVVFDGVAGEHVLDVVEQIADGVLVFHFGGRFVHLKRNEIKFGWSRMLRNPFKIISNGRTIKGFA